MAWFRPWRKTEQRSLISISDPALASFFGVATPVGAGVNVGEYSALGVTAVYRAVSLISQSIAQLPLRTMRDVDGVRTRVNSFLDNPGGPEGPTPFEWTETVLLHLLLHGNAFLVHVYNGAGSIAALQPIHPLCVSIDCVPAAPGGKLFQVTLRDGARATLDATQMTHIPGMVMDSYGRGLSPIQIARDAFGTAIAGDRAAGRMFSNGAMISGLVTPETDDITEDEAKMIKDGLDRKVAGWENSSSIAVFNKRLNFTPWTLTAKDAQFLESRQYQVEEIARIFGVPPFALMQTEKQTSWGTGIESQQRGLARTVLAPWAKRIEERLSRLLPAPRFCEFDFAGLERGTPKEELELLILQVDAGIITVNEARHIRNMDPLEGGDVPRINSTPRTPAAPQVEVSP